ncbi:hypothetical protein F373_gp220 [Bacillus phage SP-10]|uniref:hypothetical protein n=1 Tax=Bacillus phage SP10 TaxID=941058 RepID=UPI0002198BB0|nr:hypothetical protein F373_gp220 [Bacillus phage SP-10]BAK53032.1 hypothetical protein [Bacillus phage SP-10]
MSIRRVQVAYGVTKRKNEAMEKKLEELKLENELLRKQNIQLLKTIKNAGVVLDETALY